MLIYNCPGHSLTPILLKHPKLMITHDVLKSAGWVVQAVDPQQRVLFLDSSQLTGAHETRAGDTLNNSGEAALVLQLASALLAAGLPASSLALVSPFTSQVRRYLLMDFLFQCMGRSCILRRQSGHADQNLLPIAIACAMSPHGFKLCQIVLVIRTLIQALSHLPDAQRVCLAAAAG